MSLQVWLPLNGNLINQGLYDVTVTNTNATIDNSGKIGKCYSFNGSDSRIYTSNISLDCSKLSISFWFYRENTTTSSTEYVASLNNGSGYSDCAIGLSIETSSLIFVGGGSCSLSTTYTGGTWHHVVVTFDNGTVVGYLDGEMIGTVSNGNVITKNVLTIGARANANSTSGGAGTAIAYPFTGKLNDFRLYDHCLSPKEVKELSKGLVLHYRLTGPGQPNLAKNTFGTEEKGYTVPSSGGSEGGPRYAVSGIEGGKTYTVSAYIKGSANMNLYTLNSGGNVAYTWVNKSNMSTDYKFYSLTFTMATGRGTTNEIYICTRYTTTPTPGDWFKVLPNSVKIEEGSVATPWCPNLADELYSIMGYNNNIEYDCSGYGRNGTKSGNITWDIDSPRYTTSYSTRGGTAYLTSPNIFNSPVHNFTLSIWGKTSNQGGCMIFSSGPATSNPALYHDSTISWCVGDGIHSYFENNGVAIQAGDYKDGKWHHYVVTGDGIENKLYIDGQYAGKSHIYHPLGYTYTLGKWIGDTSHNWDGLMSDFRIYTTALSADDIKELYNSSAVIDSKGNVYSYSFKE